MSVRTVALAKDTVEGIALVGNIVTVGDQQFKVHSAEGRDWYAFDDQGETRVDLAMTVANWITVPELTLIPSGHKIGEGFAITVEANKVRRGVCLAKSWA